MWYLPPGLFIKPKHSFSTLGKVKSKIILQLPEYILITQSEVQSLLGTRGDLRMKIKEKKSWINMAFQSL